jgi:hypothetical protein
LVIDTSPDGRASGMGAGERLGQLGGRGVGVFQMGEGVIDARWAGVGVGRMIGEGVIDTRWAGPGVIRREGGGVRYWAGVGVSRITVGIAPGEAGAGAATRGAGAGAATRLAGMGAAMSGAGGVTRRSGGGVELSRETVDRPAGGVAWTPGFDWKLLLPRYTTPSSVLPVFSGSPVSPGTGSATTCCPPFLKVS